VSGAERDPARGQPSGTEEHGPPGAEEQTPAAGAPAAAGDAAPTYEAAAARVEEIIKRLDSGEASLDETLELVREGKSLIEECARQLADVSGALEELHLDELVSRLEREAGASR
jgi:exodeoxyribonuclease VII small subunit